MSSRPLVELIVRRYLERRGSGERISIDEALSGFDLGSERAATRAAALREIVRTAREQAASAEGRGPSSARAAIGPAALPLLDGYDLIDCVGRGGMGAVYEAYQQSTGRRVAVKFMLESAARGEAARRRFEREVELIARLQHPGIVSVLDSGVQEGRYYYVMEFIEGEALDTALAPGRAEVRAALELFIAICEAVDHAHQHGVLHRDLKPSNILIDRAGRPRVVDFGLAKTIESGAGTAATMTLSEPGQLLGTLAYMPPEQAAGRLDELSVRSDVYALGAVLYELLTGRPPVDVDGALADVLQRIASVEPVRPSSLRRGLEPDVDAILLKALEKPAWRRYATAAELAADVRRYLASEPIAARPPGTWSRMIKFARRNRALVGGVVVAALLLVCGVAGVTWQAVRATAAESLARAQRDAAEDARRTADAARERAEREANKARASVELLQQAVAAANPELTGRGDVTMREVIDDAAARVDETFADHADVASAVRLTLGETYRSLGLYGEAARQFGLALDWYAEHAGPEHDDTLVAMASLSEVLAMQGRMEEAEELLRRALEIQTRRHGEENAETLSMMGNLAALWRDQGRLEEAERLAERVLELRRRVLGERDPETLVAVNNLGFLALTRGDLRTAERWLREALEGYTEVRGAEHPNTLFVMTNLSQTLLQLGRLDESEDLARTALAGRRRALGPTHPDTIVSLVAHADALSELKRFDEAEGLYREALDALAQASPGGHPNAAAALAGLSRIASERGDADEAERLLREAVDVRRRLLGPQHLFTLHTLGELGALLLQRGKLVEAEAHHREQYAGYRETLGPAHAYALNAARHVSRALERQGKFDDAEALLRAALEDASSDPSADAGVVAELRLHYGACLTSLRRFADAEPHLLAAHAALCEARGASDASVRRACEKLAEVYDGLNDADAAARWRRETGAEPAREPAPDGGGS